ncbi:MAG: crossover junction endodeoxyribonuclease RuvC [Candidatus Nomurabacteria bacterium]|nr:crossover junction endodeoxyribonuclease RuvC [Candidatus Nomurabacteria bacterium]USN87317.1 MAG: crossover junction endodeoxyribonuclease RuvC [Candidatus Nomurabacteria bacterium]
MKVLAVDPGYDRIGVAILEKNQGGEFLHYSTCIETSKNNSLTERIFYAGETIAKLLNEHQPQAVAIETLFFNKNIKTAIGVAQARGMIIYLAKKHDCQVFEYGPQEIKIATTGYGKSDKQAVIQMVKRLVKNVPQEALDDEYDAIAVGITCLAHNANDR